MNAVQIEFALKIIQLVAESISKRMNTYDELLELFQKAQSEGRDLTDEEVAVYEKMAEKALQELDDVIEGI